jgi:hypothetical protein
VIGDVGFYMRRLAVIGWCAAALCGFAGDALAATATLQCSREDGGGTFQFTIDYGARVVNVGRFTAIPASIGSKTISFNYFLGQLWGVKAGQHYYVTFDRASGVFVSHNDGGAYANGKRWLAFDATSECK